MGHRKDEDSEDHAREEPDDDPRWIEGVRLSLLDWYDEAGRKLPWRADRDAYRILVSEFMLVQTTVAAVIPYFERFLRQFPDARALAGADEADVLKAWEGLGYYRRARQLQAAARQVVEGHGGMIPNDPGAVRALPGVGPYIAGAVLSFAFDRPEPIVEANSQRVLARLIAMGDDLKTTPARHRIWEAAGRLVPPVRAGDFNQAMMDLGATICTPREPSCLFCPVAGSCQARRLGLQGMIPHATPRRAPEQVGEACAVVRDRGRVLVVRRGPGRLWADFWEFPTIHVSGPDPAGRSFGRPVDLVEGVRCLAGVSALIGPASTTIRFGVTRYRVTLDASPGEATPDSPAPTPGSRLIEARWIEPEKLTSLTFSSASRRLIAKLGLV